jgi:hypothetical protein
VSRNYVVLIVRGNVLYNFQEILQARSPDQKTVRMILPRPLRGIYVRVTCSDWRLYSYMHVGCPNWRLCSYVYAD